MGKTGVTQIGTEFANSFTDINGRQVHQFASQMANLGFARMTEALLSMLDSGAWHEFVDGLGTYRFLPGEYDYFLTQQGVDRDHVMRGVRDLNAKARLESVMDERRTGEAEYRRRLTEVRLANPTRPGRPIEPFGLTKAEAKVLVSSTARTASGDRPALGESARRYSNSGGITTKRPSATLPQWMQLRNRAERLSSEDLDALLDALKAEKRRRRSKEES